MRSARGFTLIEVVTVVFIFTLIVITVYTLYSNMSQILGTQETLIDTAGSVGTAFNYMQNDVLQADHVVASHSFSGTTYTSTTTSMVLEMPAVNSSGDIVSGSYDYVAYYATGTLMYRLVDAAAGSARGAGLRTLSNTQSALSFIYSSADMTVVSHIKASATTSEKAYKRTGTAHLDQMMYLRNY